MTSSNQSLISQTKVWQQLSELAQLNDKKKVTLAQLLSCQERSKQFAVNWQNIAFNYSHQRVDDDIMNKLFELARQSNLNSSIKKMFKGEAVNSTENRSVLHVALRSSPNDKYFDFKGNNIVPEIHNVLNQIRCFCESVRKGQYKSIVSNQVFKNFIVIGIGGSYLGTEFVYEALRNDIDAKTASNGGSIKFLANVDPVAASSVLESLDCSNTLAIVISKTFTTAETMLNARTVKDWFVRNLGKKSVETHMIAVSSNIQECKNFGISPKNVFQIWDQVGGRYSVTSAVGILPLTLVFGQEIVSKFLDGARSIDQHFLNTDDYSKNIPVLMGLLGIWNSSFLDYGAHAIIPYSEALKRFPAHIQQLDMESNGKRVTKEGVELDFKAGEIVFGEPGTNSQHSFFQLLHQGRRVPVDFIGFACSQTPINLENEIVSNHDELMSNFFAQPDALAYGRLGSGNSHKIFDGNRPSMSLLFNKLDAQSTGQLLAIYEHRVAVQGFIWGLNSFDQFGVELGKQLGKSVRMKLSECRKRKAEDEIEKELNKKDCSDLSDSTRSLIQSYFKFSCE